MELYFIRHGQSVNNSLPEEERMHDPGLTELGHGQAARVAEWLQSHEITRLITSPFLRTLETTEYIRRAVGLKPEIWIEIHEQGGCQSGPVPKEYVGQAGMTAEEIAHEFPGYQLPDEIDHEGWWKAKQYETPSDAQQRAERLVERTRKEFASSDERVAYISHGTFKQIFVDKLMARATSSDDWGDGSHNTAVSKFVITEESTEMVLFNSVEHLPESMLSH